MTINCSGSLIDLSIPKVMGIINTTPDSFYRGSRFSIQDDILKQVEKMLDEGATFIDVGGQSSRPGADEVSEEEELKRTIPVVEAIAKEFPNARISIDTYRSKVAQEALDHGACMINDISAGQLDAKMFAVAGKNQVPIIAMHMKGRPKNMQHQIEYSDLIQEIIHYFSKIRAMAFEYQIKDLIIDPGFGFSKETPQNFKLLNGLQLLKSLDLPILIGISRKSMVYKTLDINVSEALNGTTALHMVALLKGANLLRVHDVKEAVQCIKLFQNLNVVNNEAL